MSTSADVSSAGTAEKRIGVGFRRYVQAILVRASAWATAHAEARAAATIYENLSRLSDAELHRRGLSRSTLSRDVSKTFSGPKVGPGKT